MDVWHMSSVAWWCCWLLVSVTVIITCLCWCSHYRAEADWRVQPVHLVNAMLDANTHTKPTDLGCQSAVHTTVASRHLLLLLLLLSLKAGTHFTVPQTV